MTKKYIIIPARLESIRLPEKILKKKNGKSMLWHTFHQARLICADEVFIAYDCIKTFNQCIDEGIPLKHLEFIPEARNGTERCAKVVEKLNLEGDILNLQADYPDIEPCYLDALLINPSKLFIVETLYYKVKENRNLSDVKIAGINEKYNLTFQALWFSRHLPYSRIHIGVYYYNSKLLPILQNLSETEESKNESLEQLPWLQHDIEINCYEVNPVLSVNTQEDYEKWVSN